MARKVSYQTAGLESHVVERCDVRLRQLEFDDSAAARCLWDLLLTEEDRLRAHRAAGRRLVGTMKDLGTVPVLAYASPNLIAFYPDGAWWTPCLMEHSDGLLRVADRLGVNDSFCPVRAMLGAFVTGAHFPIPDLLTCSVGAVCDDFSAIAQRLEGLGHTVHWWELPRRRTPEPGEPSVALPGGEVAPAIQVELLRAELERLQQLLSDLAGHPIDEARLREGIREANRVRGAVRHLRQTVFSAARAPLPALEMLIVEALAIHYCSDREATLAVLQSLQAEVDRRREQNEGVLDADAVRLYWVNPVADLRVMNLLENCGARITGNDYLFGHALVEIPEDLPPLEALARVALGDPMIGPSVDRARRLVEELRLHRVEALVISRIPGASHCAREGTVLRDYVRTHTGIPTLELEVPSVSDPLAAALQSRLEALVETVRNQRPTSEGPNPNPPEE